MSLAVCHIGDQALRLSEFSADQFYNIDIPHLIMAADIINLTDAASSKDQVDRLAVILHIKPVSDIETLAVYRERLIMQRIGDHQRDQLLRELIRTVVVGAAADRHRKAIGPMICKDKQVCGSLRCAVRTAGMNRRLLCKEKIRSVQRKISINLIS